MPGEAQLKLRLSLLTYLFLRTRISVLPITLKLLNNIAVTATRGLSRPLMAMGIPMAL